MKISKRVTIPAGGVCLLVPLAGCSVGMAMSGKKDPNLGAVRVGSTRGEVQVQLGNPISSLTHDDGTPIQGEGHAAASPRVRKLIVQRLYRTLHGHRSILGAQ